MKIRTLSKKQGILFNILLTVLFLAPAVFVSEVLYRLGSGQENSIIVYMLAIFIISALTEGYVYGIVGTLLGVFLYDFLITPPRMNFSITQGFPVTLLIMLLVSLATSTITVQIKNRGARAAEKEKRVELLYEINRSLMPLRDVADIAACANTFLEQRLGRSVAFYPEDPTEVGAAVYFQRSEDDVSASFFEAPEQLRIAHYAFAKKEPVGSGTGFHAGNSIYYAPVVADKTVLGVFAVSCKTGPLIAEELAFLNLVAEQAATALLIEYHDEEEHVEKVKTESEKVRGSFLKAVSFELTLPITGILGICSVLRERRESLDAQEQNQLVDDINAGAETLLSMVENMLSITRIQNGKALKTLESTEEVAAAAVANVRQRYPGHTIRLHPAQKPVLAPMDAVLIRQVLSNLVVNSIMHAGTEWPEIDVALAREGDFAVFTIRDNGQGVDEQLLPRLFDVYEDDASGDSRRELRMGLATCRRILEAHDGAIRAENRPEGGAEFSFTIPLEAGPADG